MAERKQNISTTSASDNPDDEIINDPSFLAKFQGMDIDARAKAYQDYKKLPPKIKRRVLALKKIQWETFKIESEFFSRMTDLEKEFESRYGSFHDKRSAILNGKFEPTDSDCDFKEDESEDEEEKPAEAAGDNAIENGDNDKPGIPEFWLTIFNNVPILSDSKEDCDDEILKHLTDIRCVIHNGADERPGFTLHFSFSTNDYFTDSTLTKRYYVRFQPSEIAPLSYEGPEIIEAKGCDINWKPGKNVTVKTVRKTGKKGNKQKTMTKTVKTDSFFNFFSPPEGSMDALAALDEVDDELEAKYQTDFELGQFIREQVIPRAVLFYTGEGIDEDDEYGDSETGSEEEDDDEEESAPRGKRRTQQRSHLNSGGQLDNQECKQQ